MTKKKKRKKAEKKIEKKTKRTKTEFKIAVKPMEQAEYQAALDKLKLTVSGRATAVALGIGLRQIHRIYYGESPVPPPVAKLLSLYLKHGIDDEDIWWEGKTI